MHNLHPKTDQLGMSLIELMVAMVLGLVLMAGVVQIFVVNSASYDTNVGLARLQETGRAATELIARKVRMAGYQGCVNMDKITPAIISQSAAPNLLFGPTDVLTGQNNVIAGNAFGALAGTDILTIRGASPIAAELAVNMANDTDNVQLNGNPANFAANDVLFITDCAEADIFTATGVAQGGGFTIVAHANGANSSASLSKAYQSDAMVMAFDHGSYFVRDSGRNDERGNNINSLFWQNLNGVNNEVMEGVENMQVFFGEDTDGDGSVNRYVTANTAGLDFEQVIGVQVSLLVNSVQPATVQNDTSDYTLLDEVYDQATMPAAVPDLPYVRKVFSFTATSRNRELRSPTFN